MISLTRSPRSAITHGIDATGRPDNYGNGTICGREILDTWAGEMDEGIPAGIPTCKRCAANMSQGYPRPTQAALAASAPFAVGERVGILTGLQTGSPFIGSTGVVTGLSEGWNGKASIHVRADGESESMVWEAYLLRSLDTETDRVAAGVCVLCGGSGRWDDGSRCECVRSAMERHLAGKGRVTTEELSALIDGDPWHTRTVVPFIEGERVTVTSDTADHGRQGEVASIADDGTVIVWLDGDTVGWQWHYTHLTPVPRHGFTRAQCVGRFMANIRSAEFLRVNGEVHSPAYAAHVADAAAYRILAATL